MKVSYESMYYTLCSNVYIYATQLLQFTMPTIYNVHCFCRLKFLGDTENVKAALLGLMILESAGISYEPGPGTDSA